MGELEIVIIVIIFSVILIFCICAYCNGRDKTKSGSGERNKTKSEWNYKATKELYNFCIDENARVWWNKNTLGTPQVHSFDDVLDFELVVDDNKTKGKNAIGRAVAGGLLFGGAGAVIGANTAKQVQVVSSLYINVYLKGGGFEKLIKLSGRRCEKPKCFIEQKKTAHAPQKWVTADECITALNVLSWIKDYCTHEVEENKAAGDKMASRYEKTLSACNDIIKQVGMMIAAS